MSKFRELVEEFRSVVLGRTKILDALLPPLAFLILYAFLDFDASALGSLVLGLLLALVRWLRKESVRYVLIGIAAAGLAYLIARWLGRAESFFLPDILGTLLTVVLCFSSLLFKRPLVAWTSYLARRWPRDWYWHANVRPAYSEVTLAWAVFFALRLLVQILAYQGQSPAFLAFINLLTGWPATIVLLVASYLYGTWRLGKLSGPSVEEFRAGADPPWEGQRRGF